MRRALLALCAAIAAAGCADDAAPGPAGAACDHDADCQALSCIADNELEPEDLAPLPLSCGTPTADGAGPGDPCEQADDCARGICLVAGACATPCLDDVDCNADARCLAVHALTSSATTQPLSACVELVSLPDDALVEIDELSMALDDEGGTVELPPPFDGMDTFYVLQHLDDTWPLTSVCRPPTCVKRLVATDRPDEVLYDEDADYSVEPPPVVPVGGRADLFHAPVLRIDEGLPAADGYTVTLEAEAPGDLRVTRIGRADVGRRLDLNVFYLAGMDWEPEGDRGPEALALALEEVDRILGQADIFLGEVRQLPVPGLLPERGESYNEPGYGFDVLMRPLGVWKELPYLMRLSAGAGNSAINLFLVWQIEGPVAAKSQGIPGPPGMHGTGSSGVVVELMGLEDDPTRLGHHLAHELAHYLGLFHTSESDGRVVENLEDTPSCRLEQDADGDGELSVGECEGAGEDNLMFFGGSGEALSDQQRAILQRNPVLQ